MRWSIASIFSKPRPAAKRSPYRSRLGVEFLEDRLTPAGFFLTGVGGLTNPAEPNVRVYDSSSVAGGASTFLNPPGDIGAFPGFAGSVRVANGDVNGDGVDDIITAQGDGAGSGSQIRIFDGRSALFLGTRTEIASFFAYSDQAGASQNPGFGGGVFVACADFNGDGVDELVTSAGAGARGHVKVFNFRGGSGSFLGSTPELRTSFFAYTDFAGEIRVTTLRFGGQEFLVTGSGAGTSQSDVRAYGNAFNIGQVPDLTFVNPSGGQIFPFAGFNGGVSVAAGDTDGDGNDELFVSQNAGGTGLVNVYDVTNLSGPRVQFTAFAGFTGEVRLGAADVDGDGKVEVLTSTGSSPGAGGAHVKAWSVPAGVATEIRSFFAYEGYINGVFLSTGDFKTTQTFTKTTPLAIPDNNTTVFSSQVIDPLPGNDTALKAKAVQIDINITQITGTSNSNDLIVRLAAPGTPFFTLFDGVNANGSGFSVTLSDTATTNIATPTGTNGVRLTGTFKPQTGNLLAQFGNAPLNGGWILSVRDKFSGDVFRLDSWSVRLVY